MGTLKDLVESDKAVHILFTKSTKLSLWVYDTLKEKNDCTKETIFQIDNVNDLKRYRDVVSLSSISSLRWLFLVNYKGVKKNSKLLETVVREGSGTSCWLIKVENYMEFKEVRQLFPKANDLYMSWLRYRDLSLLFKGITVDNKIFQFVANGYSSEPERVMEFRSRILQGEVFKTNKDVVEAIGVSAGSTDKLIFQLLRDPPKLTKRVIKNRMMVMRELVSVFGSRNTQKFLIKSCKNILDLKILWLNGEVYDRIADLPEGFDEMALRRYSRFLQTIIETPYSRILFLHETLKENRPWMDEVDMQLFLVKYYTKVLV